MILASIEEQGKLTDELRAAVDVAATKQALEDIYLPYKPKRRTRAQTAREADWSRWRMRSSRIPGWIPRRKRQYVNNKPAAENGVPDVKTALDGARDILSERFAETAELLGKLRSRMWEQGIVSSKVAKGKKPPKLKNSGTTTTIPKRYARSRRIAPSRCSAVKAWRC